MERGARPWSTRVTAGHRPLRSDWKDGRPWRIGTDADVAWIRDGTVVGVGITSAVPPVFESYATVLVPHELDETFEQSCRLLGLLAEHGPDHHWWLGYLETGSDDLVFPDAPKVTLYTGWRYVLAQAGPEQASHWRNEGRLPPRAGAPDLVFPADRSWLLTHLWDDDWRCLGGPAELVDRVLDELGPAARQVAVDDEDATPPGHTAH